MLQVNAGLSKKRRLYLPSAETDGRWNLLKLRNNAVKCKRVPLSALRPGVVLVAAIEDPVNPGIKLLTEGSEITAAFIKQLRARHVDFVILSQRDLAIMSAFSPQGRRTKVPPAHQYVQSRDRNDFSEATDAYVESADLALAPADNPMAEEIQQPENASYTDDLQLQWAQENSEQVGSVSEFFDDTVNKGWSDVTPLKQTVSRLLDCIAEDKDAFVCLSSTPYESDYPSRHGIHVAGVALAIGVEMGLDRETLMDLGIGCLIHDVGMKYVGVAMFDTKGTLSQSQLKRLADHPVKAIEIAGEYGDAVSEQAKLVAYQLHERLDGSGYPRGRTKDQIDPLAKIAGVADAFVGMLANRKHRVAIQGYYVITSLLEDVKQQKLDPQVVRALIRSTSLFPLGSHVELDNDCVGRVIRSGREDYVRPVIQMWHKDHLNQEPAIVNLKEEPNVRILRSIPADRIDAQRAA